jgi:predicted O-methyltransferase YrrM
MRRSLLRGLGRRLLALSGAVSSAFPPGHFYSPIVDPGTVERARVWPYQPEVLGIDFNDASHVRILRDDFPRFIAEFDYPQALEVSSSLSSFFRDNTQFTMLDAPALFVLLRALKPARIIEVGSGFSTLLMADVNRRFLGGSIDIHCIDPFPPSFLRRSVDGIARLVERRVQELPLQTFADLEAGDLLFVDSSHVAKTDSDVNFLFFEVFPRLAPGVLIHLHDIFLPHDYPPAWVLGENRSWNEQYLLRALLMYGNGFEVMFGCSYAFWRFPALVTDALANRDGAGYGGGSFWLRRL